MWIRSLTLQVLLDWNNQKFNCSKKFNGCLVNGLGTVINAVIAVVFVNFELLWFPYLGTEWSSGILIKPKWEEANCNEIEPEPYQIWLKKTIKIMH